MFVCGRAGNRMFGPPGVCRSLSGLVGLVRRWQRDGCNDRLLRVRTWLLSGPRACVGPAPSADAHTTMSHKSRIYPTTQAVDDESFKCTPAEKKIEVFSFLCTALLHTQDNSGACRVFGNSTMTAIVCLREGKLGLWWTDTHNKGGRRVLDPIVGSPHRPRAHSFPCSTRALLPRAVVSRSIHTRPIVSPTPVSTKLVQKKK